MIASCQVWVVDNGSTDGSIQMVRERFPSVRLLENSKNLGFAKANNLILGNTNSRKILLLNPDSELADGTLKYLSTFVDTHPNAGAVGPMITYPDGALQRSAYPAPTLAGEFLRLFHLGWITESASYRIHTWSLAEEREVDVIQGVCVMIRREALNQVGLMDEDFFMYSEEVDLCKRIRTGGWTIYWTPRVKVVHHEAKSTSQAPGNMFLHLYRSKVLYFRKNHGSMSAIFFKLILLGAVTVRLALSPFALLERPSQRKMHLRLARQYGKVLTALSSW